MWTMGSSQRQQDLSMQLLEDPSPNATDMEYAALRGKRICCSEPRIATWTWGNSGYGWKSARPPHYRGARPCLCQRPPGGATELLM
jgi:hypothetical protein